MTIACIREILLQATIRNQFRLENLSLFSWLVIGELEFSPNSFKDYTMNNQINKK